MKLVTLTQLAFLVGLLAACFADARETRAVSYAESAKENVFSNAFERNSFQVRKALQLYKNWEAPKVSFLYESPTSKKLKKVSASQEFQSVGETKNFYEGEAVKMIASTWQEVKELAMQSVRPLAANGCLHPLAASAVDNNTIFLFPIPKSRLLWGA